MKKNDIEGALEAYSSCGAHEKATWLLLNQIQTHTSIESFAKVSGFYWALAKLTLATEMSTKSTKYFSFLACLLNNKIVLEGFWRL